MNKFKHSGAFGDLIYSLPIVKHFGGGEFYLHLNQINWIGQYYYGSPPAPFHQGRLTVDDYNFMQSFMSAQDYITAFDAYSPEREITHNLDRFRTAFVGHPGNYIDIYSNTFNITDPATQKALRTEPWLTVPTPISTERDIVINRTARWVPRNLSPQWAQWRSEGWESRAVFVGLAEEYHAFIQATGWNIPHQTTDSMLALASVIAGARIFIGNQSQALSLAIGLGVEFYCEHRDDLPLERNECYFHDHPKGTYF